MPLENFIGSAGFDNNTPYRVDTTREGIPPVVVTKSSGSLVRENTYRASLDLKSDKIDKLYDYYEDLTKRMYDLTEKVQELSDIVYKFTAKL